MKFLFFLFFLSSFISKSQTFEKSKNSYLNESYIRYYDRNAGILIQKVITVNKDSSSIHYELGLLVFTRGRETDDFMDRGAVIAFDDKTYLLFTDQVYVNYFQEGKHQYSIKHILSMEELQMLQSKKIDYISVLQLKNPLDKWQKQDAQKAFFEITKQ